MQDRIIYLIIIINFYSNIQFLIPFFVKLLLSSSLFELFTPLLEFTEFSSAFILFPTGMSI